MAMSPLKLTGTDCSQTLAMPVRGNWVRFLDSAWPFIAHKASLARLPSSVQIVTVTGNSHVVRWQLYCVTKIHANSTLPGHALQWSCSNVGQART
jgi:hypothetical protein